MTFDAALIAALDGALIRRSGWKDPDRVAYRVLTYQYDDYSYYTLEVSEEDRSENDWVCCGWLQ
jgi:hypothetical protein